MANSASPADAYAEGYVFGVVVQRIAQAGGDAFFPYNSLCDAHKERVAMVLVYIHKSIPHMPKEVSDALNIIPTGEADAAPRQN